MTLSEYSVNKPVTVLLTFIALIGLGIYCTTQLPVDMYPNMKLPYMLVYTEYKNAGPEEVEQSLTRILENGLSGATGLKKMQSQSSSGLSLIFMEFNFNTNLDAAVAEIRDKIDLVRSYLPTGASSPTTIRADPSLMPIMALALQGNRTPEELRRYAKDIVQPRLEQIDGVASAEIVGGREKSINVDIPRDRLEAYGLSITSVAQMIGSQNVQSSGGTITSGDINYTIKTSGKYTSVEDLKNTVISYKASAAPGSARPRITTIRLRDVADVYEGYKDENTLAYLNGTPCVILNIQKQSGKNSVNAAHAVRKAVKAIKVELPSDVDIIESSNDTDIIEQTIAEVVKSVIQGALLAVIVLFIFLRSIKSTVIIGLAIPVSVFITLFLMYFTKISINMISMAGLLLGIGMLVDNSIVVLENIYAYRQKDAKPRVAAVLGSQEMILSISASTFTSVCIFLPMLMFKGQLGMMGQIFNDLAMTIIFSLLCSLVVAIVLVPVLSSKYLRIDKLADRGEGVRFEINRRFTYFFSLLDDAYARGVKFVLHRRKLCIFSLIGLLVLSVAAVKFIGFIFMPEPASNTVSVKFELPKGTRLEVTDDTLRGFETTATQELKGVKYSSTTVGGTDIFSSTSGTNTGTVTFTLYPAEEREKGWDNEKSAKAKLRKYFNKIPGVKVSFAQNQNGMSTGGMSINVKCDDLNKLRATGAQLEELLREQAQDVVTEVSSDLEDGLPQVELVFERERMYELGVNVYTVGSEVAALINGTTASRYTDNGDDIDVIVRLSKKDKTKLADLDLLSIVNASGERIPLSNFAHYKETTSPVTILRENQARVIHITAKPVSGLSLDKVQDKIQKLINANIPKDENVRIGFSGDYEDMMEAVRNFGLIIIMASILVFIVMASQFESFMDPFIVLFTIPLSFIGVIAIYALNGSRLSVVTVMGVLVLVGTIVNNGIVLVDYTNLLRKRGLALEDACVEAARNRLRPILMSTLTTVISLMPMAFFPGEGSASMQPISLTVFGGMTFGSLMTLFVMPTVYYIVNSRRQRKLERKLLRTREA
ncbi:efflux RND transporter permease subunit [Treponema sp. Marseille-Q4523]|uniref:efflux RND transporter permease subunit n=1 Tax=Treponema sp. Marseille-Q4523 TaxID=2810610 RepID=UPI001961DE60|nr:efflux RND transporter permease subunit [Treponema sp. Marseille-Q4523]MBM7023182.1 efflux RND transporter permease subunit [Treponema sp. Marseille-Q4523]